MDKQSVDTVLVRRVQAGDRQAFDLLVRKYHYKIAGLLGRYLYDQSDVEDITQEVFIKAYRAIGNFRGDSAFYTWIYRIAINTAKNYLVAQDRRPPNSDVDAEDAENLEVGQSLRDLGTPENNALSGEIARHVTQAVDALPEELRMAITLRELEGLSYEEIAQVMECPIGTVRSRIFRAREAIEKVLEPLLQP